MFDPFLAFVFICCGIYGIYHANKVMRETAEGKRQGTSKISDRYSYAVFFWLD